MNLNDPSSIETLKPKSYELHSPIRLLFQEKSLTLKKKKKNHATQDDETIYNLIALKS